MLSVRKSGMIVAERQISEADDLVFQCDISPDL
jgi:hypothetical protein